MYARDAAHPEKQQRASQWMSYLWQERAGRLSFQVLQEFYVTVTTKLRPGLPVAAAREEVRTLMTWKPVTIDEPVVECAWVVQDQHGFSWWDALIVGAAQTARCRYLLTEDLQDGQQLDTLLVINPFRHDTHTIA